LEEEYLGPDTPDSRFQELAEDIDADVVLSGHSHQAFAHQVDGTLFINPGSVGRPDDGDPRAAYAILEIHGDDLSVRLFRVPYNLMVSVRALQKSGLPEIFTQVLQQGMNYNDVAAQLGNPPQFNRLEPNGTLTLLTDFGLTDHFIGVMKGVILDIAPQTRLVDISHQIHPQNVMQGARMLAETVPYFTPGTVHVAVVDPGVGTRRRAIAARIGSQFFVAPDNGLLSFVLREAYAKREEIIIVSLTQEQYWLPEPSYSFHGRDIFAPVGAHLVNGLPLEKLGETIDDPVLLIPPLPEKTPTGWLGQVVMIDTFGNLATNLSREVFPRAVKHIIIEIKGENISGLTPTFGDAPPGSLIATIDSSGALAISVVNGSAQEQLNADIGTPVNIRIEI
jgi:S-adenosylmethionine hydrolase